MLNSLCRRLLRQLRSRATSRTTWDEPVPIMLQNALPATPCNVVPKPLKPYTTPQGGRAQSQSRPNQSEASVQIGIIFPIPKSGNSDLGRTTKYPRIPRKSEEIESHMLFSSWCLFLSCCMSYHSLCGAQEQMENSSIGPASLLRFLALYATISP